MAEETRTEGQLHEKHPKKGGKLDKYKWWIIGGLAVVAALVFYFVNRSNAQAQTTTQTGQNPQQPGFPYGFPGMGARGLPGRPGRPGKRGPRGPKGPKGGGHHKHHHHKHHHHHRRGDIVGQAAETRAHNFSIVPPAAR